ncbi:MAG TPA: carotenoid 1,2-hydratase [Steroidobacter sp.]|nr:carotenoid 1,2-hydratase [Steroidobacteraceae bacterium]HLS82873.1 carotenoid 1,2-hydratase [Steroidobacter sp.]
MSAPAFRRIAIATAASCAALATAFSTDTGEDGVEYPQVQPGHVLEFPRDEGAHPRFRTEWWYVTGWLETESGEPLGFQITFFRSRPGLHENNPSRFAARQLLFAHAALSDPRSGELLRDEKAAREGFGLAAAKQGSVDVHIDDWSLRQDGDRYRAVIVGRDLSLDLEFVRTQPPLLQGDDGFSRKGPDVLSASYYYSLPHLQTHGRVVIHGQEREVAGASWFDHEWSTSIMDKEAAGWDWVGLNLDGGGALMAFRMRDHEGGKHWAAATLRDPTATGSPRRTFPPEEVEWTPLRSWRSPRTGVSYPVAWRISVAGRQFTLEPLMDDQENDARGSTGTLYWEGAVRAYDERGAAVGRGYLELTGYGSRIRF